MFKPADSSNLAPMLAAAALACCTAAAGGAAAQAISKETQDGVFRIRADVPGGMGTGTAFLISGKRELATNHHVVAGATALHVYYVTGGNVTRVPVQVVRLEEAKDLAIVRAAEDLPGRAIQLAVYVPEVTSPVIAVGYPGNADVVTGTDRFSPDALIATVTTGAVSRVIGNVKSHGGARVLQHNAAINPGNSGGPLFDKCGAAIGVNSFMPANRIITDESGRPSVSVSSGIFFSIFTGDVATLARSAGIAIASVDRACGGGSADFGGRLTVKDINDILRGNQ